MTKRDEIIKALDSVGVSWPDLIFDELNKRGFTITRKPPPVYLFGPNADVVEKMCEAAWSGVGWSRVDVFYQKTERSKMLRALDTLPPDKRPCDLDAARAEYRAKGAL